MAGLQTGLMQLVMRHLPVRSRLQRQNPVGVCVPIWWRSRAETQIQFGIYRPRIPIPVHLAGLTCPRIEVAEFTLSAAMKYLLMGTPNGLRSAKAALPPG